MRQYGGEASECREKTVAGTAVIKIEIDSMTGKVSGGTGNEKVREKFLRPHI